MNTYDPLLALLVFLGICLLGFLFFRPNNGWFWLINKGSQSTDKIIVEDILKRLYHNENAGKYLNINDIVRTLKQNDKMVIDSIDNMATLGLVRISGDIVKLTKSGSDYALRIIRAHRLWERYLADKTGFNKTEWHQRAERKEHELSMDETNLLAHKLGNPQFDPHGDPIPTITGKMAELKGVPVSELKTHTIGRIIHIKDKPDIIYKQIMAENIHIGSIIRVVEKSPERIVFHSEGEAFKLAPIMAGNITVSILEKNISYEEDILRLNILKENEKAKIIGISKEIRGESRRRLLDLGFVKGASVSIDLLNPLGEPKAYLIKGTSIALRNDQASKILIKK
ncbi:DtxR family transcriptional regulator [Maribacter polysiphoniae]|uniref:DtxR family Mn-dependent transcriptional regulator n=1 Tax=Maribacter polysiphoniae TaxID=429344 RepID=A0A316DQD3_9FLAO|nr:DtxR family transcriptional regulator [Maribacter polysiphoniae]MBD1262867.1 DtxR family transcriptional regulator [Maribacter polysiphoniae]PWK20185.1 DtxR family Mn-dependent transcriptional regulator [Maribacter polysiphoniae]